MYNFDVGWRGGGEVEINKISLITEELLHASSILDVGGDKSTSNRLCMGNLFYPYCLKLQSTLKMHLKEVNLLFLHQPCPRNVLFKR